MTGRREGKARKRKVEVSRRNGENEDSDFYAELKMKG